MKSEPLPCFWESLRANGSTKTANIFSLENNYRFANVCFVDSLIPGNSRNAIRLNESNLYDSWIYGAIYFRKLHDYRDRLPRSDETRSDADESGDGSRNDGSSGEPRQVAPTAEARSLRGRRVLG